jgi:hypothetical protein
VGGGGEEKGEGKKGEEEEVEKGEKGEEEKEEEGECGGGVSGTYRHAYKLRELHVHSFAYICLHTFIRLYIKYIYIHRLTYIGLREMHTAYHQSPPQSEVILPLQILQSINSTVYE